ncbi:MAG TPA: DUF1294 domain-containing protein [Phenylobacterium sp.]|nr:DUF1294 domain-containing protein [Phenylobacterium sp.]
MTQAAGIYLVAINAIAFLSFRADKQAAIGGRRRIPEATLLQLALVGGSIGAVCAQQLLRHKTRKQPFVTWLTVIVGLQAGVGAGLAWFALMGG